MIATDDIMKVVYEHWLDNKCIYVGCGNPWRAYSNHRSKRYYDVVQNRFDDVEVRIVKEFDSIDKAKQFEEQLSIKRRKEGHPVIGLIGNKPDDITKARLSNANTGKKRTNEQKLAKSRQTKQLWKNGVYNNRKIDYAKVSNSLKGRQLSEETKKKISESLKRRSTK